MTTPEQRQARIEAIFAAHYGPIAAYFRRRCADEADADDATAQVFAVAWRRLDGLPSEPDTRLWLYGVARRVLATEQRSRTRRTRLQSRLVGAAVPWSAADPAADVERSLELRAAWGALSDADRELLALLAWDGLRVAEIARVLGIPAPLVSARLSRARRRLAQRLEAASKPSRPEPLTRPLSRPQEDPDHA